MKLMFNQLLRHMRRFIGVFISPTYIEEWTNPPAADDDYYLGATATSASPVVLTLVGANLDPPRPCMITSTAHAHFTGVTAVVAGYVKSADGTGLVAATENLPLTNGGNAADQTTTCWVTPPVVTIPGQGGTSGSYKVGFGAPMGLGKKAKTRAAKPFVIAQSAAGTVFATNGTFNPATTHAPNGSYSPDSAPDGARDYALQYELDPDAFHAT